ncbi:hypothetical protein [Oceanisphaera sediminis]|uniref:hypothetical protein n=1 Tax=Oceanisphaera sediminis TaxID=981381 RepID=UPI0031E869C3
MSRYFSFRFIKKSQETKQSLVLFCHSDIEVSSLIKEIKEDVMLNLVPSDVVVIGYGITDSVADGIISNSMFASEFESFVGAIEDKLEFITVDKNGDITTVIEGGAVLFKSEMMLAGANKIFKSRKGLITSSPSYHFAKPSGDHCDKFIRASNLFTSGVEVAFLAICLLPHLTDNIKRIYVDTSSISFLISIAVQLSKKFQHQQPIIESFESYSVFKEPFGFVTSPDSLVIISATTSGGLVKSLIRDTAFSPENILTLFFHIYLLTNVGSLIYRMLWSQVSLQYHKSIVNFVNRVQRLFKLKENSFYLKRLNMSYWSLKKSISILNVKISLRNSPLRDF